ncbi:uncharacterized protein LOC124370961 [Homalodisca vitripennis]|uniref:uncharacterized protein LOC124370961 n=1 Tax=Homalodisca vitripennis TaxID=197043 RepID=UPI001EEBF1E5|nr:uncharacterized protein LOC124370961 [Homalodisca vitripennis]
MAGLEQVKATLESQASLLPCRWLRDVTVRGGLGLNHLGVSHPHTFTYFHLSLTPVNCDRLLTTGHICWGYCVCGFCRSLVYTPSKCCVPECKSNYVKPFVNVFSFPKDPETFRTWLRAIHRDSCEVTSNSRVCIKHFDERYIIKEDTVTRPDGTILTVKRDRLKLRNDAVPTIFENLPNYIGKDLPAERKDSEERRREAEERHQKQIQEEERRDRIDSFSCLTNNYSKMCNLELNNVYSQQDNNQLFLFLVSIKDNIYPTVTLSLNIKDDLSFYLVKNNNLIDNSSYLRTFSQNLKIDSWSKLRNIIKKLSSEVIDIPKSDKVECISSLVDGMLEETTDTNVAEKNKLSLKNKLN